MKKINLLAILFAAVIANGQTPIANGTFDNWTSKSTISKGNYWDLAAPTSSFYLCTLNQLFELEGDQGDCPLTAFRVENEDSVVSNYALRLISAATIFGNETVFMPGAIGTWETSGNNIATEFLDDGSIDTYKPFTSRPVSVKGYAWYFPVGGDSASVEIVLKKGNTQVGYGRLVINASSEYEAFECPITYTSTEAPTLIQLIVSASAAYNFSDMLHCNGQAGSTLYVDELELNYSAGIKENLMNQVSAKVMPNPSSDQINLVLAKEVKGLAKVYDNMGRLVNTYNLEGNELTISLSNYANGQYLINVEESNKVVTSTRFIKQ